MSVIYETQLRVDSRDVDLFNQCRPSAVLGLMQEAATQAAQSLGVSGLQIMERYGCIWMVVRSWVDLEAPLRWDDQITIQTWHRGASGVSSYRDFEFYRDGQYIGQGVSSWVMVEAERRRMFRLKDLAELQDTDGGSRNKAIRLYRVKLPEAFDGSVRRDMGYSDTDINGHVNNMRYADFACDALHLERLGQGKFVRSFQIGYVSECRAGEPILIDVAHRGNELFARGAGEGGAERFDFSLTLAPL